MSITPSGSWEQARELMPLQSGYTGYIHTTYGTLGYNNGSPAVAAGEVAVAEGGCEKLRDVPGPPASG